MSNPDKDFPNDPDRFTPLQDVPDLQNPEVMPDPVMDRHLASWAQQVEAESATAGPEEKPSSPTLTVHGPLTVTMPLEGDYVLRADPWPPLSREQVVELHEALVGFRRTMESSKTIRDPDEQMSAIWDVATSLDGILVRLNIGAPRPPPRQEENLGGFACLDERRMGPEVKRNCWTCANNQPPRNNCPINGRLDVAMWVGSTHGWTMDGMPPKDSDGCPGWTPKS